MSSGNGQQPYNVRQMYQGVNDDSEIVYGDNEEYMDDYAEDYVQLPDGSFVPAVNQAANSSQGMGYNGNNYGHPSSSGHSSSGSTVYAIRGSQMYRVDKVQSPAMTPQSTHPVSYKYVKTAVPGSSPMDQKTVPPPPTAPVPQPMYHVPQQGPSYSFQQPASSSYNSPFPMLNTRYEPAKPAPKTKRKHLAGQRKPCNCTKSMCLKLYCDCFANGEFCRDCNCKDCHNNMEFEADRTRAIKQSLERNPNAFKPKIGVAKQGQQADLERLHQKGCHCKKSGCLKNYCECYEAKVPCTDRCKCKGCQNTETDRAVRFKDKLPNAALMNLANTASIGHTSQGAGRDPGNPLSDDDSDNEQTEADPRAYPWFYMTDEVVEAATLCMVAQAEESLDKEVPGDPAKLEECERLVLREFGRCLEQIISSAGASV